MLAIVCVLSVYTALFSDLLINDAQREGPIKAPTLIELFGPMTFSVSCLLDFWEQERI